MSWLGWVAVVIGCIVGLDVVFIMVVVTMDWYNERRDRHEKRRRG